MESIAVKNLYKIYKISQRQEGFTGMVKYLFHPQYKEKEAVKGISFSIHQGECVAFLGANGAGKSTTIKMLTGIMKPTEGKISVMGNDPFRERIRNAGNIGVVFGQKTQLWWDIPVKDSFELLHSIYEIPDKDYKGNLDLFKEILELEEFMDQPARKLSLGQRVRADIAAALLHDPPILFLDEPTIGLDVAVKQKVYQFLQYINKEKKTTILLTSHDLKDMEWLCRRLIILEKGEILFDDEITKIFDNYPEAETLEEIIIELFNGNTKN
ncbi:ATP-binding cassette domain-containing protein [Ruminococcus sp. AF20-12LB]|nr:ATP-binding cassette domain-containing protein [Ruminococcus sp. AF20-12LB]